MVANYNYDVTMKIILYGLYNMRNYVLQGCSIRKIENHGTKG